MLLAAIAEPLDERLLEQAVLNAVARLAQCWQAVPDRRPQIEGELVDVETRIRRCLEELVHLPELAEELRATLRVEKERKARRRQDNLPVVLDRVGPMADALPDRAGRPVQR